MKLEHAVIKGRRVHVTRDENNVRWFVAREVFPLYGLAAADADKLPAQHRRVTDVPQCGWATVISGAALVALMTSAKPA